MSMDEEHRDENEPQEQEERKEPAPGPEEPEQPESAAKEPEAREEPLEIEEREVPEELRQRVNPYARDHEPKEEHKPAAEKTIETAKHAAAETAKRVVLAGEGIVKTAQKIGVTKSPVDVCKVVFCLGLLIYLISSAYVKDTAISARSAAAKAARLGRDLTEEAAESGKPDAEAQKRLTELRQVAVEQSLQVPQTGSGLFVRYVSLLAMAAGAMGLLFLGSDLEKAAALVVLGLGILRVLMV